jgi:hypothetical protein
MSPQQDGVFSAGLGDRPPATASGWNTIRYMGSTIVVRGIFSWPSVGPHHGPSSCFNPVIFLLGGNQMKVLNPAFIPSSLPIPIPPHFIAFNNVRDEEPGNAMMRKTTFLSPGARERPQQNIFDVADEVLRDEGDDQVP